MAGDAKIVCQRCMGSGDEAVVEGDVGETLPAKCWWRICTKCNGLGVIVR